MTTFDTIIANGLWFDGKGSPPAHRHLGIRAGRVATISESPLSAQGCPEVIDAKGQWVLPGFVDIHTHYDAEVLVSPGLEESVRHGVTSVFLGSCSLSTIYSSPLDCADLFSRVEAVPRDQVLGALEREKTWDDPAGYVRHLESKALGPNIAAFLGHSDLRTSVMGLGRAVEPTVRPDVVELEEMRRRLVAALDAGFLGLSGMTTPWDKLDGDRYRSRSLPSTYATWKEHRWLNRVLRRRGRVLQSAPNTTNPSNGLLFALESAGFYVRKPLRTSLLVAADAKALPAIARHIILAGAWSARWGLQADMTFQCLPVPFQVYADGIDFTIFEEFGSGQLALHLSDELQRNALMQNEAFRRQFRRDLDRGFDMRLWTRNLHDTEIVACPDSSVVGRSFGAVADERGVHPADAFLDLVVEHGKQVRWCMVLANHRPEILNRMTNHSMVRMGFADSGAHLRNMAFYNMPVRMLKRAHQAQQAGRPFMTLERAVHRLTGELGDYFGVEAGHLREGDPADIVLINPAGLDDSVDGYYEADMPGFDGFRRMVNRSDSAVNATLVNGQTVFRDGQFADGFGTTLRSGRFLRAGAPVKGETNNVQ